MIALCIGLGLSLVVLEFVLRVTAPGDYFIWSPNLTRIYHPKAGLFHGIEGASRFVVNSEGVRGDELAEEHDFLILTVGGSTTECSYLSQDEAWPSLLQGELRKRTGRSVWVGNAGKSGISTREHVLQLPALVKKFADTDAIVMLVGVNDMTLRLARDEEYDAEFMDSPEAVASLLPRAFAIWPESYRTQEGYAWYKRLALWSNLRTLKNKIRPEVVDSAALNQNDGSQYAMWRLARRSAPVVRETLPDLGPALDEYEENLNRMIDTCVDAGIAPIIVTQPSIWRDDLSTEIDESLYLGYVSSSYPKIGIDYYNMACLKEALERYNGVARRVCKERGISCVDLANLLPRDQTTFYDDIHFNESGARRVAKVLADSLEENVSESSAPLPGANDESR